MSSTSPSVSPTLFGLLAEFATVDQLKTAADRIRETGYKNVDGYTPFPVEDLGHHLGIKPTRLPFLVLAAGVSGSLIGFGLQAITSAIVYPLNIGGRPLVSIPSFIPITFEVTVLCASMTAAFGMLLLNGLPRLYHPVFNVERFKAASNDGLFLSIEASDPLFERDRTADFLESLGAKDVFEIVE